MRSILVAAFMPTLVWGQSYEDHRIVEMFISEPCTEVLDIIESEMPTFPENPDSAAQTEYWRSVGSWSSEVGMTWGFILGYDTANRGLERDAQTTLQRLKSECANSPELPAVILLEGMTFS